MYDLHLTTSEVADLVAIASIQEPEKYRDGNIKSVIYKAKALVAYQSGTGDHQFSINVRATGT